MHRLHVLLGGKAVNGSSLLFHTPTFGSSVLSRLDNIRNRPDGSGLAHVESSHGFLIRGKLVGVENATTSYKTGVSVLVQPVLADFLSGSSENTLLGVTSSFNGFQLFVLASFVVGSGSEAKSFPDAGHLGGSQVGLADEGEAHGESGQAEQGTDFIGFLDRAVHLVTKTVLVKAIFQANFGDDFNACPFVVKAELASLKEAEVCVGKKECTEKK